MLDPLLNRHLSPVSSIPTQNATQNVKPISGKFICENFNQLSLTELEKLTGISASYWCKWFRGKQCVSEQHLTAAGQLLKISPGQLLDLIIERRKIAATFADRGKNHTPKQYKSLINR